MSTFIFLAGILGKQRHFGLKSHSVNVYYLYAFLPTSLFVGSTTTSCHPYSSIQQKVVENALNAVTGLRAGVEDK